MITAMGLFPSALIRCSVCNSWTNGTTPDRILGSICKECRPHVDSAEALLTNPVFQVRPPEGTERYNWHRS